MNQLHQPDGRKKERSHRESNRDSSSSSVSEDAPRADSDPPRNRSSEKHRIGIDTIDQEPEVNGYSRAPSQRRASLSNPARDPRDEPAARKRARFDGKPKLSPTPVIDFEKLSRPSQFLPVSVVPFLIRP